jgi:FixJ family two-component response regulator
MNKMHGLGAVHVVDDNDDIRKMLTMVLESHGYTVHANNAGEAFLRAKPTQAPHAMLLDLRMPGMSGLELNTQIKASGNPIPIIFMSGESQPHETQSAITSGAAHFLWKPFDMREMLDVLEKALAVEAPK